MNFLVKFMCFIVCWECVICRPSQEMHVDYRSDLGGMSTFELCEKYPNGAIFPNLLLSCMGELKRFNNQDSKIDVDLNSIKKLFDEMDSILKIPVATST